MQEKDLHNEVDDIIVKGIIEHGKKIEQMEKWQRGGHKSVAKRLLYAALAAAAIFLLGIVIHPGLKKAPPAYKKDVAYTQKPTISTDSETLSVDRKSKETDHQLAYTDRKKAKAKSKPVLKAAPQANRTLGDTAKKVSPYDFPFIVEEEERKGNGSSLLSIVINSGLREFGMERLSLEGSNADSLMNHLDLFVDDDYDAEWARILLLAKVNRREECRELLKEFIKKEGSHKEQAIRLNELIE